MQPINYFDSDFFDPRDRYWIGPVARLLWGRFKEPSVPSNPVLAGPQMLWDFIGLPSL